MNQKRARQLRKLSTNGGHYKALKDSWNKLNVIEKEKMYENRNNNTN